MKDQALRTARNARELNDWNTWTAAIVAAYGHPADPSHAVACAVVRQIERDPGARDMVRGESADL